MEAIQASTFVAELSSLGILVKVTLSNDSMISFTFSKYLFIFFSADLVFSFNMFDHDPWVTFNFQILHSHFLGYVHSGNHSLILSLVVRGGELKLYCYFALFPIGPFENDSYSVVLSCWGSIYICNPCFFRGLLFFFGYIAEFDYKVGNSLAFNRWS